ncbi:MAG: VCBS repeat-containing protein [Acidobacteriota bacterium]
MLRSQEPLGGARDDRAAVRVAFVALQIVATVCATACRPRASGEPQASTNDAERDAIAREFKQIALEVKSGDNFYWGEKPLSDARASLAAAGNDRERLDQRLRVAFELLKLGKALEAITEIEACRSLVELRGGGVPVMRVILKRLAMAHLRAGETANCVMEPTAESCFFPIGPGGVHAHATHASEAAALFRKLCELEPDSRSDRWLLSIAAMQAGTYPESVPPELLLPERLTAPEPSFPRFPNVAGKLGITATNLAGGAVTEDFDGDGFLDVMFSTCDPDGAISYYHARGDGTFALESRAAGLDVQLGGLNLMQTDYDNDGVPDVLVTRGGWQGGQGRWRMSLLHNDGRARFTDVTRGAGLAANPHPTQAAAWGDYDGDGDLDLYVGNEVDAAPVSGFSSEGQAFPGQLFRNDGDGKFTDVAATAGVTNDRMAKGVAWGDMDDDGDLDLYVSNIGPNRMYENLGGGTFRDVAPERGLTEPEGRSFATWFWDYDNDGHLDVFVAGFHADVESIARSYLGGPIDPTVMRSRLYHGVGGGRFEEVSARVGLDGVYLPMGANYGDLDNDGWPDVYLGTGDPAYETLVPNVMFHNEDGLRFEDVTFAGGFGHLQKGHGIAFADLDNDGDQDVVLEAGGFFPGDRSPNVVLENPGNGNHWITLRLSGTRSNRAGFGARIAVDVEGPSGPRRIRAIGGTGGSFGAGSLEQEIGLGDATRISAIEIAWVAGARERFAGAELDAFYEAREGSAGLVKLDRRRVRLGG